MNITTKRLPKIGDVGLAIPIKRLIDNWEFDKVVYQYMMKHRVYECWFQCFNQNGWCWMHGIVAARNGKAIITQIG